MATLEHGDLPQSVRHFRNAFACASFANASSRLAAWQLITDGAQKYLGRNGDHVLDDLVFPMTQRRKIILKPGEFIDFVVLVGEQGSGKKTMASEFARRRYSQQTMSDVVRSVAPILGYDPDSTQGKIDAGHAMRRFFDRSIIMKLCMFNAEENKIDNVVIDGPRSSYEVRAARANGARIIGLVADNDAEKDRQIRFARVVRLRSKSESDRVVTPDDFYNRERQEHRRIQAILRRADRIVVTNRAAADLADALMPGYNGALK